jgi:hypothetical protein
MYTAHEDLRFGVRRHDGAFSDCADTLTPSYRSEDVVAAFVSTRESFRSQTPGRAALALIKKALGRGQIAVLKFTKIAVSSAGA